MADPFQPILTPTNAQGIPNAPVSPGLPTAEALVGAGITGLEVAERASDIGDVNEFKKALGVLSTAREKTNQQIEGITAELEGADKATVSRLGRRLALLATGQEQGSLTTTQATARASVEFRKAAAANPRIEDELRQTLRLSTFGGSSGGTRGSQTNPLIKAAIEREKMVADLMFRGNVTRNTAENFLQSQQTFEQIKLDNDIASQKGIAGFSSTLAAVGASAQQIQYSMLGDLNVTLTEQPGSFDPNMFKATVTQATLSLERDWAQRLNTSGIQFTAAQRKEITTVIRDTRDMIIAIGDSRDPKQHLERINQIMDAEDKNLSMEFLRDMGPQFRLMSQVAAPEQVFNTLFNTIPKALGKFQRDPGKFDGWVQAAEDSGDIDMIFALQFAQANPTLTVKQWRDMLNGNLTGTRAQIELNRNLSGQVLNASGIADEDDESDLQKAFDFLAKNTKAVTGSEIPTTVSALYQPGFANQMLKNPKLGTLVQNLVANRMFSKGRRIGKRMDKASGIPIRRTVSDVREGRKTPTFKLFIDEDALANPIITERGFFTGGIKANKIFKIGVVGMTQEEIAEAPAVSKRMEVTSARALLDIKLLNEYVATLSASGRSPDQIRKEIDVMLEAANGEEPKRIPSDRSEETIEEVTKDPFSFLRGANETELNTLIDNATDSALIAALKREKARRAE